MKRGNKCLFDFRIRYFKPSGKWYTEISYAYECATLSGSSSTHPDPQPYMNDVVAHIRGLRDSGGQGAMPGLSGQTEGWDGFIEVFHEPDGFPTLILPPNT